MYQSVEDVRKYSTKPVLFGEFGIQQDVIEPQGVHFHDGLWAGIFSGSAGTGMLWWWDTYIEPNNLYYHYKGISKFFAGEQLPRKKLKLAFLSASSAKVEAYALMSEKRVLLWVKCSKYNYRMLLNFAFQYGPQKPVKYPAVTDASVTIPGLLPGSSWLEVWAYGKRDNFVPEENICKW